MTSVACKDCPNPRDLESSSALCKECRLSRNRLAWNRWQNSLTPEDKQIYLATVRTNQLKALLKKFGFTLDQYYTILTKQNYCCAICLGSEVGGKGRWHIDHDHLTGKFRGLLCHNCNIALGNFKDSVTILKNAINYLGNSF